MIDCRKYRILKCRITGRVRAFGVLFACVLPVLFSVACNTEACLESKTSIFGGKGGCRFGVGLRGGAVQRFAPCRYGQYIFISSHFA